jgi:hypothetical protein
MERTTRLVALGVAIAAAAAGACSSSDSNGGGTGAQGAVGAQGGGGAGGYGGTSGGGGVGGAGGEPVVTDEVEQQAVEDGELQVTVGDTSLWVASSLARRSGNGPDDLVLSGGTSRDLATGRAFVFDHDFGAWTKTGAQLFELSWPVTDIGAILDGTSQFMDLSFATDGLWPTQASAHVVVRPRLVGLQGSGATLAPDIVPIVADGTVRYRIYGTADAELYDLGVQLDGVDVLDLHQPDATHFAIDLTAVEVLAAAGTDAALRVDVSLLAGQFVESATLGLYVHELGLTSGDAYAIWPAPSCQSSVRDCLQALPAGTLDLASCGEALDVLACSAEVGVTTDGAAVAAAVSDTQALVADPSGLAGDAAALVAPSRVDPFLAAVDAAVAADLQGSEGRWFLDAQAQQAGLAAEGALVIDHAYARPLDFVAPLAAIPGDAQRARDVAADGLLLYLGTHDFAHTEFSRPLVELARVFRAQHVESIRFFRQDAVATVYAGNPAWDDYLGNWLSALCEVRIDRATGALAEVFLEIG